MMMTKPKQDATSTSTSTNTTTSLASNVAATTTSNPADAVADLERRLADLSAATPQIPKTTPTVAAPSITTTTTSAAATSAVSNKNALLARIIAAQERAKQAQSVPPPGPTTAPAQTAPPSFDLLSMSYTTNEKQMSTPPPAPPSFDNTTTGIFPSQSFVPPPMNNAIPPPAFDDAFFSAPPTTLQPPPPPPAFDPSFLPPPSYTQQDASYSSTSLGHMHASAPSFEDLMMEPDHPPAFLPPPVPPPTVSNTTENGDLDDEAIKAILGIEGLSEAEKQELINEQLKIMKSIEDSKKSAQLSAADAFEQRSFSAAVQAVGGGSKRNASSTTVLGMERTQQAIADGTAVVVQCTACGEWMQVTGAAQFMMCSSCNTMTQVQEAGMTSEEAQQMIDDAKLAEQLQKEEYEEADRAASAGANSSSSPSRSATAAATSVKSNAKASSSSSTWMEWLGFGTPAPAPASRASNDLQLTYSRDSADDTTEGLLGSSSSERRQGARVVTQQPLFACVTDSISSAANYAINSAQGLHEDADGNVHGVDSSSLLAVTQVGRGTSNQSYEQMPGGNGLS